MLNLQRPLVFIDIESTGLDRERDRIIDIALHKVYSLQPASDGVHFPESTAPADRLLQLRVNPGRPIPEASSAIHGITDSDVAGCPRFPSVAGEVLAFLEDTDIAGYNSTNFDVPMLNNEFRRCGINWIPGHLVDVGTLFKIREPRHLTAAVRFYTGEQHRNGHTAVGDALATLQVFQAQLARYDDLPDTIEELAIYSNHGHRIADISGKFYYDEQHVLRFNFGKHKDEPAHEHLDFLEWMYRADFPADTNELLNAVLHHAHAVDEEDEDDFAY